MNHVVHIEARLAHAVVVLVSDLRVTAGTRRRREFPPDGSITWGTGTERYLSHTEVPCRGGIGKRT